MTVSKQRSSNFELLRILAQLAILAYHFQSQQSFLRDLPHNTIRAFSTLFLGSFGRTGVVVFIIIGSWFLIDMPFRSVRFVRLYLTTWFYTVTVTLAFLLLDIVPGGISGKDVFIAFTPFTSCALWFVSCYLFLLLISPFLNCLIRHLPPRLYRVLYWILLAAFVFFPTLDALFFGLAALKIQWMVKSDLTAMIAIYMIVGYWKKVKEPFFADRTRALHCVMALVACVAMLRLAECFGKPVLADFILHKLTGFAESATWDIGSVICFGLSSSLFFLFRSFPFSSAFINRIAKNILGVYILHQVPCSYLVMWTWFHAEKWWNAPYFLLGEFGVIAVIFAGCWLIDFMREWLMKPLYHAAWMQRFLAKLDSFIIEEECPLKR